MDFLNDFVKKVTDVTQTAVKKSGEAIEVTRLKSKILAQEKSIEDRYKEIGEMIYEQYDLENEAEGKYIPLCEEIKGRKESITEIKLEISKLKGEVTCINCNFAMIEDAKFCPKCGVPVIKKEEASEDETEGEVVDTDSDNQ